MISKQHRFHGRGSVRRAYADGRVARGKWFSVRVSKSAKHPNYRAAVVVSKKVSNTAVGRNLIRRRLYEIVRLHPEDELQSCNIIINVFTEDPAKLPFEDLQQEFSKLFKQASG